jgi:geranylgeranyl diphosphate synthase type II
VSAPPAPASDSGSLARSFLAEAKARVEAALERFLPPAGQGPHRLAEAMRYSVMAGGKRLRPALALAGCRAVNGDDEVAIPYACALEMVHTYSLIHDDLPAMDDDDLRRGRKTSHKVFGEAMAILAGDALHTLAFDVLLREVADPAMARRLGVEIANAAGCEGMVGGQVDDLVGSGATPDADRLQRIHERKTGWLIRASVVGGGIAGGADAEQVGHLSEFGLSIGLAFQITDDVLDETGTAETLGKTPGKDRREEKMTYVALEGIDAARARAKGLETRALEAVSALPSPELLLALAHFVTNRDR